MKIENLPIDETLLSPYELAEILRLFTSCRRESLAIEDLWLMMDQIWQEMGCNQYAPSEEDLARYYSHPVWVLNGLFSEQDIDSQHNRQEIIDWVILHDAEIASILDFGGGIGSLARSLAKASETLPISVYEPTPHAIALERIKQHDNVQYVSSLNQQYDCIICLDVMEHLTDPLQTLADLIKVTKPDGYLIFGNCFFPVIQCHLPQTFHLRYTFNHFAQQMGLTPVASLHRNYISVFQKENSAPVNWSNIRQLELISKLCYPPLNAAHMAYRKLKQSKLF